jgi:Flp pilus assembly protein TadD
MDLVHAGNMEEALSLFRAACRFDPSDVLLQNDLGVTEMRLGQLKKAQKRFLKALELDPSYEVPKRCKS